MAENLFITMLKDRRVSGFWSAHACISKWVYPLLVNISYKICIDQVMYLFRVRALPCVIVIQMRSTASYLAGSDFPILFLSAGTDDLLWNSGV